MFLLKGLERRPSMLNNTPVHSTSTPFSNDTPASKAFVSIALLGGAAIGAVLITFVAWFLSMTGEPGEAMDKAAAALFFYLMLAPIALAGAYWLSLFRLRQVKALRTWLEALGFSFVFLPGMHILLGVGAYVLQLLHLPSFGDSANPWAGLVLYVEVPALLLYALLVALATSGLALGIAVMFTDWHNVRAAHLPGRGWLDCLLVLGCVTLVALLTGLAFVYCYAYFQDAFIPLLVVLIAVPGAMVASLAAWTTSRTLQKAVPVKPTPTGTVREAA
jgi:hypothetical protein